jgi:hypothetical protein
MTVRRLIGSVAALLALIPLAASASDLDDALKLAGRVATYGFQATTVTLHRPPADFPDWIPLPKASLLGSLVSEPVRQRTGTVIQAGRSTALYFDAPVDRASVLSAYREALRAAGWTERPRFPGMPQPGGFVTDVPQFTQWCLSGAHPGVLTVLTGADAGAITLQVQTDPSTAREACTAENPFGLRLVSPLPRFEPVAGLTIDHAGPTNDGTTTGARITSSLGGAAVYDAFAKQLSSAGWKSARGAVTTGLYTGTFTKTVDGKPYVALLTVHALDATHYVALTDVSTLTE